MLKWLIGFLASISAVFTNGANKPNVVVPPLNTAIIAYQETYYVPAVTNPGNFPWAKTAKIESQSTKQTPSAPVTSPPPPPVTPPPPTPTASVPPQDPYLANPEPIINWLRMDFILNGEGFEGTRTFSPISIDREYWKILYESYWISLNPTLKTPVETDYFKLEVYEQGTDKLIFSVSSGNNEWFHGTQTFKKPGKYYFKTYTKPVSKYEMNFLVSPKIAQ